MDLHAALVLSAVFILYILLWAKGIDLMMDEWTVMMNDRYQLRINLIKDKK